MSTFHTIDRPTFLVFTLTLIILIRSSSCTDVANGNDDDDDSDIIDSQESSSQLKVTHYKDPPVNGSALTRELITTHDNQSNGSNFTSKSLTNLPKQRQVRRKQLVNHEPVQNQDPDNRLLFDSNYFATLNAVNHRPVLAPSSISLSAVSPLSPSNNKESNNSRNLFYYSPETYGKVSHRNHQNTAFTFSYNGLPVNTSPAPTILANEDALSENGAQSNNSNHGINKSSDTPTKQLVNNKAKPKIAIDGKQENSSLLLLTNKKKDKNASSVYLADDKSPAADTPFDDTFSYDIGDSNNGEKYYYQDPFLMSTSRSKGMNLKQSKPFRYPEVIQSSPSGSLGPSPAGSGAGALSDYIDEDYDSSDSYAEFKNYPPMIKASMTSGPKYSGPAPYRFPMYTSYYPTRFYAPYDETSPGKSSANGVNSWSGLAGFLLGILPLGILMASIVPAFVSVPVATATAGMGRKKRSLQSPLDKVRNAINEYENKLFKSEDCIKKMLCNTLKRGKSDDLGIKVFQALESM